MSIDTRSGISLYDYQLDALNQMKNACILCGGVGSGKSRTSCPIPKRVIYDEDAGVTVVLWTDDQKTIVRAAEGEDRDVYDAFCAAYCKRVYGSNSALKRELNKILTVKKKEKTNMYDGPCVRCIENGVW